MAETKIAFPDVYNYINIELYPEALNKNENLRWGKEQNILFF